METERELLLKRRKERRKKIRKRRILTAFITFLILSLAALVILCFTVFFSVEQVVASGSKLYTNKEIISAANLSNKDNLLLVNEKDLTVKIREKLPFIDSIEIEREFPSTIIIKANDAKEYAVFRVEDKYFSVSKKGFVLKEYTEKPENLFLLICDKAKFTLGKQVEIKNTVENETLKAITENLISKEIKIDYVDVTDSLSLKAKVDGRFIVNFGTNTYIDNKISHLKGMLLKIDENKTGNINLSMWTPEKTEGSFVQGDVK